MAFCGSLIVILGVIVECVDLLAKCSKNNWCHKWGKRLIWHSNDRRVLMQFIHGVESINLLIEIIGFVLVVGGLGMELYGGTKALLASDLENRLLKRQLSEMEMNSRPRSQRFNREKFTKVLQRVPGKAIEILYDKNDLEGFQFAQLCLFAVQEAGWSVKGFRPFEESDIPEVMRIPKADVDKLKRTGKYQYFDWPAFAHVFGSPADNSFALIGDTSGLDKPLSTNNMSAAAAMGEALQESVAGDIRLFAIGISNSPNSVLKLIIGPR